MSEQDTREKLEADVRQYANPSGYKNTLGASWEKKMLSFLDRQAAITSAEWCWSNDALEEELTRKESEIAELKAEVEKQRQRANDAERGVLSDEWYVARDRYEDDVAALTAERDRYEVLAVNAEQWKDERDQLSKDLTAEHALLTQFEYDNEQLREHAADLTAEIIAARRKVDELREAIDAMGIGQFYAMYREACDERDELKREHEQERQQMQRVIDTQRESFKKMEFELAQAKGGSDDEG